MRVRISTYIGSLRSLSRSGSVEMNLPTNAGDTASIPGSGRFPWRRKWQPTPVFLPGEFHEQRGLADYSSWGCKESDMTEHIA